MYWVSCGVSRHRTRAGAMARPREGCLAATLLANSYRYHVASPTADTACSAPLDRHAAALLPHVLLCQRARPRDATASVLPRAPQSRARQGEDQKRCAGNIIRNTTRPCCALTPKGGLWIIAAMGQQVHHRRRDGPRATELAGLDCCRCLYRTLHRCRRGGHPRPHLGSR